MFRFNPALENLSDSSEDELGRPPPRQQRRHRRRVYRPRTNMELFDEKGFKQRFRLSKATVLSILQLIGPMLMPPTGRNHAITPLQQILLTLRFYAMGSMLLSAGDFAGVAVASACRTVWSVTKALARLRPHYVKFSNNLAAVSRSFYELAQFPRVLGAIDCTHVRIQSPGGDDAEVFRNRKDYFSINVQTVAGPDLKIFNIVAKWPGSVHDATIFDNSQLKDRLEGGVEFGRYWLLGDSAYPLKPYLLTPLANPANEAERKYNHAHIATRNPVERSYGVWKRRFPVMALKMRLNQERILAVIVATAVLHNIAVDANEELLPPEVDIPSSSDEEEEINVHQNHLGQNVRANLIRDYFAHL